MPKEEEGQVENASEPKAPLTKDDLVIKNPKKIRETFGEDSIICCICGEQFKSLGAHLRRAHNMSSTEYCKLCDLPEDTVLMSKNYGFLHPHTQNNPRGHGDHENHYYQVCKAPSALMSVLGAFLLTKNLPIFFEKK